MLISLNSNQITDEMLAITALRSAGAGSERATTLLSESDEDGLNVIIRMVFAELLIELGGRVTECRIDDADHSGEEPTLGVEFQHDSRLPDGMRTIIRRQLEHAVAAGVLEWVNGESDNRWCSILRTQRRAAIDSVTAYLDSLADDFGAEAVSREPVWG